MHDEDSGEEIGCPYCGKEDCEHLLAVLDRSYCTCELGYASARFSEFRAVVERVFQPLLLDPLRAAFSWGNEDVQQLWQYARDNHTAPESDVEVDGDVLMRLTVDAFIKAGGEQYDGTAVDDGYGPGNSSALSLFHAENPAAVFNAALEVLAGWLQLEGDREERTPVAAARQLAAQLLKPVAKQPKPKKKAKKPRKAASAARGR